jgi:hypothetical protein
MDNDPEHICYVRHTCTYVESNLMVSGGVLMKGHNILGVQ